MAKKRKPAAKKPAAATADTNNSNTAAAFDENRYIVIKDLVSQDFAELAAQYALANEQYNPTPHVRDKQVPNSYAAYADFLMESMLLTLQPKLEKITGLKLLPTYSYYRVYKPGATLEEHTDREQCEISCTLCLGYDYLGKDYKWRIKMGGNNVALEPGDAVIYRGMELPHSRKAS